MVREYFLSVLVMFICSTLFLWLRAAWQVGLPGFEWAVFYYENRNRLILQAAGCFLFSAAWIADPAGLRAFAEQFGPAGFFGSTGGIGLLVGYLSLWKEVRP